METVVEAERPAPGLPRRAATDPVQGDAGQPLAEARSRGRLQIPQKVVQRIAAQAASEVSAAGGRRGGVLGIGARTDLGARPKVEASLSSDSVDLSIELAVEYPVSLRAATGRVRDHVTRRVESLTGIAVHRVDIEIIAVGAAEERSKGGELQ